MSPRSSYLLFRGLWSLSGCRDVRNVSAGGNKKETKLQREQQGRESRVLLGERLWLLQGAEEQQRSP